ncbi:3(2),5-bisphosphate nucleotidase HAL2 [Wilcoxina mikolae CBS 423.85]|nr:3(2),5-bisphosphate nucleotidase HAL2 [Wilcoxina mikolae CBS 423.85]
MASTYAFERKIAELAVRRASILTNNVYHSRVKGTVTKEDKSPVTIADFGAQSAVIGAVLHAFPGDSVVGEEDADVLRQNANTRELVWDLVRNAVEESKGLSDEIGTIKDDGEMMDLIDRGNHEGGASGRIWALDPIDGTKGFLRGDQYAVCLALMVDGEVVVGAMGCPNLLVDPSSPNDERGVLFSAVKGAGATQKPLFSSPEFVGSPIMMNKISDLSGASFCEGVEAGHSSHGQQAAIAKALGITKDSVRMDSQAKYGSIARGDGDVYLRLPTSATYQEKIWDHAAGKLLVEEAGGVVSDVNGKPLDFSKGRTLKDNKGVVASLKEVHQKVIDAVIAELSKSSL